MSTSHRPGVELDDIRIRFATYRDLEAGERARLAAELGDAPGRERVLIDTCHRVELVTVAGDEEANAVGRDAVRRLFAVVAGFDSAVVAEEQLIGQVRGAYEAALARRETGPILNELFRRALRFGRRVRAHARPGTDRSLADPGLAWLLERLGAPGSAIVAGTGEMGRLVARRLAAAGHRVTIASRSMERGGALLEELPGDDHHLVVGPIPAGRIADAQAVVLAVRTRAPVLALANLDGARPWVLDLSTPPAVAADAAAVLADRHLGLDELGRRADGQQVLEPAVERRLREELEQEVDAFARWIEERRGGDAIAILHREADAVRRRHLARLRSGAGLDEAQLEAVEAVSAAMIGELLHGPSIELRRGGTDADVVRRLFGVDR